MMLLAAAATLAFAPPIGTPLVYEAVDRKPSPEGPRVIQERIGATFAHAPDGGYVLTVRLLSGQAPTLARPGDANANDRDRMDAAALAAARVPVRLHLDRTGIADRVEDGGATWAAYVAALRTAGAHPPANARVLAYAAQLAAQSPSARDAQLVERGEGVASRHIVPLAIGQSAANGGTTVAREPDGAGGIVRYRVTGIGPLPNGGRLLTDEEIDLAPATGLIVHKTDERHVAAFAGAPTVELDHLEERMVK